MKAALPELTVPTAEQAPKDKRFGNRPGSRFYNGLDYKRVKGKLKVRGERKIPSPVTVYHPATEYSEKTNEVVARQNPQSYSPERWKEIKAEEKKRKQMKPKAKKWLKLVMYRLFGHDPSNEYRQRDLKIVGNDSYTDGYGIFEYNAKPFDL